MKLKVISGGQTGADLGGLWAALFSEVQTGGRAPQGFRTQAGPQPTLRLFGITDDTKYDYRDRTIKNINESDATVVFATKVGSPGTKLTINQCARSKKLCFINDVEKAKQWLEYRQLLDLDTVINIAGNSTRNCPRAFEQAFLGTIALLEHVSLTKVGVERIKLAETLKDKYPIDIEAKMAEIY